MTYMLAHQQRNELQYVVIAGTSGRLQCKSVCHLKLPKFTGDKSGCITKFYDPEELKSNEKQKYCWNSSKILSKIRRNGEKKLLTEIMS
jgi:hypothetical protein